MSAVVAEKPGGRQYSGALASRKVSREYIIVGATDEGDARTALLAAVPSLVDGLVIDAPDVTEVYSGIFDGKVAWITPTRKDEKEEEDKEHDEETVVVNFDTTGGTTKLMRAFGEVSYGHPDPPFNGIAPESFLAIGLTDDGIEGVDVPAPSFKWTETWQIAREDLTWSYQRFVARMTNKVNDAPFRGFGLSEVRFLGATSQPNGDDLYSCTFHFEASMTVEDITVGEITGIYKRGWDYLWTRYETTVDETTKKMTRKPIGVYVSEVSEQADFSELGIGTEEITL